MKVRIGFSAGGVGPLDAAGYASLVDRLEMLGFDSLWVPEVLTGATPDPLTALAVAAGRTRRLKLGTHLIAPGRAPARLAKELATLDRLSEGRLLLTFVIGLPEGPELSAGGVSKAERTARLEELLPLLRRLWAGETVTHHGAHYRLDDVSVQPTPVQDPLEVWFGGMAPSALRRAGRLADGWIPGLVTVEEAATSRAAIEVAAADAGRVIDPEHFGANVIYSNGPLPPTERQRLEARARGADVADLVPASASALVDRLGRLVEAGFSKFVLRPAASPESWDAELGRLADRVLGLQSSQRGPSDARPGVGR